MSIELMERALEFITGVYFGEHEGSRADREKLEADLTTAIQQAEVKTDEPVAWLDEMLADTKEVFDANGTETPQVVRDVIEYVSSWITVYNEKRHPAPGVPDGWRRVFESARNRLQDDEPSAFDNSGYRSYASNVLDGVEDELEAIDTAMLTASQAQKGQP